MRLEISRRLFSVLPSLALFFALAVTLTATDVLAADPQLGHMVYFKLNDANEANRQKLVAACDKYLSGHDGTVYYSAGILAADLDREVNDRDFDVALHLVFRDKAAHDTYQVHARHLKFIEENKATWAKVRVFDSYIKAEPKSK